MKLKNFLMTAALALVSMASANADSYVRGDLLLAFSAPSSTTGGDVNFVIDIGAATYFRDLTGTFTVANIGTQLASIYGADWATRTDLSWGVVSTTAKTGSAVNGDPAKTSYISLAEETYGTHNDSPTFLLSSLRTTLNTNIYAFSDAFATAAGTSATTGYSLSTETANGWATYTTNSTDGDFSSGLAFTGAVSNGTDTSTAVIDLFRILNTNTGANPSGTVGVGSYEGSFTLSDTGVVSFTDNFEVVPEPSTYAMLGLGGAIAFYSVRRRRQTVAA